MLKLYLDEDVHKKVATALRLKGYDVVSAHEAQTQSLSDERQLEYAVAQQRAIFTFNAGDFDYLHKEYLKGGRGHFGIILSKQYPIGETVKRLTVFLFHHKDLGIKNSIHWV